MEEELTPLKSLYVTFTPHRESEEDRLQREQKNSLREQLGLPELKAPKIATHVDVNYNLPTLSHEIKLEWAADNSWKFRS